MTQIVQFGKDSVTDRDLYMIEVTRLDELPDDLQLPSRYFVCLLAWDAREVSSDEIGAVARKLISQGGVYFCTWGPDCKRVHDIIDEEAVRADPKPTDESVIMTTWHEDEPLTDAIWFLLHNSLPGERYFDECRSTLAISVGSSAWADHIRSALSDPRKFSAQLMASDKGRGGV